LQIRIPVAELQQGFFFLNQTFSFMKVLSFAGYRRSKAKMALPQKIAGDKAKGSASFGVRGLGTPEA